MASGGAPDEVLFYSLQTLQALDAVPIPAGPGTLGVATTFTVLSPEQQRRLQRLKRIYTATEDPSNPRSLAAQLAVLDQAITAAKDHATQRVQNPPGTTGAVARTADATDFQLGLTLAPRVSDQGQPPSVRYVPADGPAQEYSSNDEDDHMPMTIYDMPDHDNPSSLSYPSGRQVSGRHVDPTTAAAAIHRRVSSSSFSADTPTTGASRPDTDQPPPPPLVIGHSRRSDSAASSASRSSSMLQDPDLDFTFQRVMPGTLSDDDYGGGDDSPSRSPAVRELSQQQQHLAEAGQYDPWRSSEVALRCDEPQPAGAPGVPVRHVLSVISRTVMRKPAGFKAKDEAMAQQGPYCKSCLTPLAAKFSPFRLGKSWDSAKFCYYTGYYYCRDCHPASQTTIIPSRVLMQWDFLPMSVCNDAYETLELRRDLPLYCISASNPRLYDEVSVLQAVRNLRVQLMILRDIGIPCPAFRRLFFGWSVTSGAVKVAPPSSREPTFPTTVEEMLARGQPGVGGLPSAAAEQPCVIPESRRYLVEDSEFWSLADLIEIHNVQPYKDGQLQGAGVAGAAGKAAAGPGAKDRAFHFDRSGVPKMVDSRRFSALVSMRDTNSGLAGPDCELAELLKRCRSRMIQHVLRDCPGGGCTKRAAKVCPACRKQGQTDLVFPFDLNRVRNCVKCGSTYHRGCWNARKSLFTNACLVCMPAAPRRKKPVAGAADEDGGEALAEAREMVSGSCQSSRRDETRR